MISALTLPAPLRARPGPMAVAVGAAVLGGSVLRLWPGLEIEVLARGAAIGAGWFLGGAPERVAEGWLLDQPDRPVAVTAACSAADFFVMVTAVLAWRLARPGRHPIIAIAGALATAVPVAMAVNALRIVAVTSAHRWLIPRFPDSYSALLHMTVGAAVFLPALIALHLGLEFHGHSRTRPATRPSQL